MDEKQRPNVGLGIIVIKKCSPYSGKVLLAPRPMTKIVGAGAWQLPGGHLEMYEEFADAAKREISEECGDEIVVDMPQFFGVTNNPWPEKNKHYVTIFLTARWLQGEAKCSGGHGPWTWFDLNNLPKPLFEGVNGGIFTPKNIACLKLLIS